MPHSAILLAGGKSSRMGRDKAALLVEGVPLWRRQLEVLRASAPAEVLISGRSDGLYADGGAAVIPDQWPETGPLGGLATVLPRCAAPWILVLAVDMPRMTADYLRGLVAEAERTGRGVVPRFADGQWQPLAAVYPREAGAMAEDLLQRGERRMEALLRGLQAMGQMAARSVAAGEEMLFENWNAPEDVFPDKQ